MLTRQKSGSGDRLKFWIFFIAWVMAGYLLCLDRFIYYNAIWDHHLWLLLGIFAFGFIYRFDFFVICFWLMVILGSADFLMGFDLNVIGPSCWSGFEVWALSILAGLAGCLISYCLPRLGHERQSHAVRYRS